MNRKKRKNKKRFSRILPALLGLACLLLFAGVLIGGLGNYHKEIQENPIQGISAQSSLKGYLGTGYAYAGAQTDSQNGEEAQGEQAQILDEEEPEENPETGEPEETDEAEETEAVEEANLTDGESEQNQNEQSQPDPGESEEQESVPGDDGIQSDSESNTIEYGDDENDEHESDAEEPDRNDNRNQDGAEVPVTPTPEVPSEDEDEDRYPTIATDLADGETVNASYRTFYVQAKDWYGNSLGSTSLEVYGNGQRLSASGEPSQGVLAYRLDLEEDANTIDIKATDAEGWSTTLPTFTIYKGEEDGAEPAGSVSISIEAGTVGLGTILPATSVDFYQGEQLSSVVLRLLQNSGLDWRNDGDATGGFYLKAIGRGGITAGAAIPDDLMAHLQEVNCQLSGHDANWLGEFDFTMDSGWLYFVNGEYMNVGMSAYFPADGDEIRIRFSLYSGADVGAGLNGETWGDW